MYVVALPVTEAIEPPLTPPPRTSAKSAASTPLTASLKVTVQRSVVAFVGSASARSIDRTVGAVVSMPR